MPGKHSVKLKTLRSAGNVRCGNGGLLANDTRLKDCHDIYLCCTKHKLSLKPQGSKFVVRLAYIDNSQSLLGG